MSTNMPKVSVITLTSSCIKNNRAAYLKQCIESVSGQTYKNIEHIVIDNASNDGTLDILNNYKWLKVFSEPDNGIYDAMNRGIKFADGEYILFLNSDDYFADNTVIDKLVSAVTSGGYDFVAGCCNVLASDDVVTRTIVPCPTRLFYCMSFAHPAFMIKREFMNFIGGFDTSYRIAGDYDFILRAVLTGARGIIINDVITNFRDGGISTTELDVCAKETVQCLIKNIHLSERQARFAEKWGYIPTDLLKKILSNVNEPFEVQKIIKNNRARMIHFLIRQLFTLHLGKNILIRFLGITIINKKTKGRL